jgi:hypothetical protein
VAAPQHAVAADSLPRFAWSLAAERRLVRRLEVTEYLMAAGFVIVGLLLLRFRHDLSRLQTDLNQSSFPLAASLLKVTPGGVALVAIVCFVIALLALLSRMLTGAA